MIGRSWMERAGTLLCLLVLGAGQSFAHSDSPGSPPLLPTPIHLKHRTPRAIVSLFAREHLPVAPHGHIPRAARIDEAESLVPPGVDGVLLTGTDQVIVVGTEGVPDIEACIQVLDVPLETSGPDRERMVLTLRRADARQLRALVLRLPEAGAAVVKGRQLTLEGKPAWLHRAERQVIRAELREPATTGLR
jgi:hypothetical protein